MLQSEGDKTGDFNSGQEEISIKNGLSLRHWGLKNSFLVFWTEFRQDTYPENLS